MRRVSAFLRRHPPMILAVLVILLAVVVVVWIFSTPIASWLRSAQSFDASAFLGEHLLAVAMIGGCLLVLALIWLPKWQAARSDLTTKERLELENDARKGLAEIVGGAALLVGLYFTWANLQVTQETATKDRETTREGQITERFTKAIDQLGHEKLQIRLGGIYALERIARESPQDHWPIMEVLTAYVRETAPWRPKPPKAAQPSKSDQSPQEEPPTTQAERLPRPATDIQAILTVLGRRTQTYGKGEQQRLNLANTDVQGANLTKAQLQGAILTKAQLQGAFLAEAQLQEARLQEAQLEGAIRLTVEQLSTVKTLYQAYLDPPLLEQIQQQSPQLLEKP